MKKTIMLSLMGLMICLGAIAQLPQRGKYYRIINANEGNVMRENWGSGLLTCNTKDTKDLTQVWQYTTQGGLQNVYTGKFIQPQPNTSHQFSTGSQVQVVNFTNFSDGNFGMDIAGNKMHRDNSNKVVRWNDDANPNNHWKVEEVSLTKEEVDAARKEFNELSGMINNSAEYSKKLEQFFTNASCTELKADYASKSDEELKADFTKAGLPSILAEVAVKIKNNWWNDTDKSKYADKNKYAKEFRVAKYQPYSDANNWRDKMYCKSTCFMGNPTGIYAKNKEIIHVFVGTDIPENATLYLTEVRNHGFIGGRDQGVPLKKGYNAIIAGDDSLTYFVNYVVNTVDPANPTGKTIAKISDFPALDIHIEGGQCVGYYQKPAQNSAEEDAKYKYLMENANKDMYFSVKGEHTIFYFRQNTFAKVWPTTIWNSIDWFDKVKYWEMGIIGVMDDVANGKCENGTEYSRCQYPLNIKGGDAYFPTYCNNPSMAIEGADGTNPHCSGLYTSYPGTWGVESSFNVERADFDTWCCGHEHGHSIQTAYNLESCTESSVNLGSQVINYLTGYRMSRGWNFDQSYEYVAQNVPFGRRDISITMRMYYNLYLYYHTAGKKKDFYPTFVKSLRENPMKFGGAWIDGPNGGASHHRATNTWIKFYKLACDAAQEDLTEYFRMWGFFIPCDKEYFGDYASYYVSLSQQEIDQAIKEVKAKGYPENLQIIFMEDRQILRERKDIWASKAPSNEKMKPENWGVWVDQKYLNETYGNVGDVLTFIDGSANTSSYTYIQSGNKITMNGKGGAGFIVYDKAGNIAHMSNRFEFEIPAKLATDGFTIKVINGDGTSSVATDNSENATDEEKAVILQKALDLAAEYLALEDATGKKVGFFSSEAVAVLKGLANDGKETMNRKDYANYLTIANSINTEVLRLQVEDPSLKIVPNAIYNIICVRKVNGGNRFLTAKTNDELETRTTGTNSLSKWAFVPSNDEGVYYVQNNQNRKLLAASLNNENKVVNVKMAEEAPQQDAAIKVVHHGKGVFAIRPKDATNMNMHNQGYITVWGDLDEGSQWNISLVEEIEDVTDDMFNSLIINTDALIEDMCDYSIVKNEFKLQASNASQAGYISTNEPNSNSNFAIGKAVDGNISSYFKSNNNNASSSEYHYLLVDLGSGKSTKEIQFTIYGDRSKYATSLVVYGSTNKASWTKIGTVNGETPRFESQLLKSRVAYRYWKFEVVATDGTAADNGAYPWFTVKEFELFNPEEKVVFKPQFDGVQGIVPSFITSLKERRDNAEAQMNNTFRTKLTDLYYYNQLKKSYDNLYEKASAIDPTVDIECIEGVEGSNGKNEIYDLSGRKISSANGNGVFIINGKKVVK